MTDVLTCKACLAPVSEKIGRKDKYDLLRCGACRTVIVDPWPTVEELQAHYQNYFKTGHYLRKKNSKIRRVTKRLRRILRFNPPGKRFLDVGCSVGFSIPAALKFNLEPKGIDLDASTLEAGRTAFGGNFFEQISIEDLAARGDRFDMAYANEVIEHVPDPESFVRAVAQALAPGGIFYVTCPDGGHKRVPKNFADWDMVIPPDHLTYFSRKGLTTLLARHGLEIKKFQWSFKPGIKAIAVKKSAASSR